MVTRVHMTAVQLQVAVADTPGFLVQMKGWGPTTVTQCAAQPATAAHVEAELQARPVLGSWVVFLKGPAKLERDILRVKPSARTHTGAPHCGSPCHLLLSLPRGFNTPLPAAAAGASARLELGRPESHRGGLGC